LNWYYFGARYYDPAIARWLSVDPLTNQDPSISPYVYCANNPLKFIDPTGMRHEISEEAWLAGWANAGDDGSFNSNLAVTMDIAFNNGFEAALNDLDDFGPNWTNAVSNVIQSDPFGYLNAFNAVHSDIQSFMTTGVGFQYPNQAQMLTQIGEFGSMISYSLATGLGAAGFLTAGATVPFAAAAGGMGLLFDAVSVTGSAAQGDLKTAALKGGITLITLGIGSKLQALSGVERTAGASRSLFRSTSTGRFVNTRLGTIMSSSAYTGAGAINLTPSVIMRK